MKKITLLFAVLFSIFRMNSQVVLNEGFTSPFSLAASGWGTLNLSSPIGGLNWFQGGAVAALPAYDGAAADFYACNYNNAASAGGGISSWLITPTVTIYDGAVISFATRCPFNTSSANFRPDRLQLRMSQSTASTIPTGTTSVGPFTDLLLDINPNLNTSTVSAASNGSVNGYPNAWTVYSVQISGVTGTVQGRFSFRYFVDNGGNAGANSNYIGLDRVVYTLPCGPTVPDYTICPSTPAILTSVGGLPATTYSWSNGGTSYSTSATPAVTTPGAVEVFTLYPSVGGSVSCGTSATVQVTIGSQMTMSISATSTNVCSGKPVTLSASGPTSTFTWVTGTTVLGNGAVITVTPSGTTTYSVGSLNGTCQGGNQITINSLPTPTLSFSTNPSTICLGAVSAITITASGANSYTIGGLTSNPASLTTPTASGAYYTVITGKNTNGCSSSGNAQFTVNPTPTITVGASKSTECINRTITLTGNGADTYSWSGAGTGASNPLTYSTGTVAGNKTFTVVGTNSVGCSSKAVKTVSVALCTGIENNFGGVVETSVFPNPFTNELKIGGLNGTVEIYNALGQVILNTKINDTETINTSDFQKGVYILKAYNDEGQELKTMKLLKN